MRFRVGSNISVSEIVTLSPDASRRWRATQYFKDGALLRRTLIDERKVE